MVLKIIDATEIKVGTNIIIEGTPCVARSIDISKTGKHGHAKCRIEAITLISGQKKIIVLPGHDRVEVPMVDKRKGQVLSKLDGKVSLMDSESFETLEVPCSEDVMPEISEGGNCEYWDIEGEKIVKRGF